MSRMAPETQIFMMFLEEPRTTRYKTGKLKLLASFWYRSHLQTLVQFGERCI